MPQLGLAGDVGFNRHRNDDTIQVWGGHTQAKNLSYLVKEVLDKPIYNCNHDAGRAGKIYGPQSVQDLLDPHPKHNRREYKAFQEAKLGRDRPLLWARDSDGKVCTYETRPSVLNWPVANLEEAKEACRYYPHQPNIIMKTIMNFADDFEAKRLNSQTAMFRAMGVKEIAENILERMSFSSRAQLSRTCSDAMLVTGGFQILYDLTRKDLQCSEYTEEEFAKMKQDGTIPENRQQRGTKYLLVSQSHLEYIREPSDIIDPDHPSKLARSGYRRFATYCTLSESVGRLARSILLRGANTEHLTLHRIPFADGKVIAGWVKHMPKLKRLEIIGCEMMRFHHMAPFYRDIAKIQEDHGTRIDIDISPLHETGTRWENKSDTTPTCEQRSGEYVVCWADVGIKIPSAVAVELYWQLFPAMVEAGQWESIFDISAATRQYLERLPMPQMAIPILIRIFSEFLDIKRDIEEAEANWADEHPAPSPAANGSNAGGNAAGNAAGNPGDNPGGNPGRNGRRRRTNREAGATPNPCPGIYDTHHWPSTLRRTVTEFTVKRDHALAFAMFGTERWIETADRNEMSTNAQCRTDNYGIWGADKMCVQCKKCLPMIAFTGGGLCENCRLKNACEDENDHLKQVKQTATRALGFDIPPTPWELQTAQGGTHTVEEPSETDIRDITRSNFPKPEAFCKTDEEGNRANLVNSPSDLAQVLSDPEGPLVEFFTQALYLDMSEAKHGPIGRIGFKQKKHPSGQYLQLGQSARQMAGHYMYRRCLSIEEFIKTPNGLTPKNVQRIRGGF